MRPLYLKDVGSLRPQPMTATVIQVLSDLHLEFRSYSFTFRQTARLLALAGDIGDPADPRYAAFLFEQADRFEQVLVIKGNHECYLRTHDRADELISEICSRRPNLIYLNKTRHDLCGDVVVLGATLWSHVPAAQEAAVARGVRDHLAIDGWSVRANNQKHAEELAWLTRAIAEVEAQEKLAVVVTHHAPTLEGTSAPCFADSPHNSAFASECDDLLRLPVAAWIFGHTHWSCDRPLPTGCRLVSNQLGYLGEKSGFRPGFCIEI